METFRIPVLGIGGGKADKTKRARGAGRIARFRHDESGSFVIFSIFLLISIFIVAGIAVDVVRFEAQRTRLQNTLDRAILAAADMSQKMPPEDVVESYFDKAGLSEYLHSVSSSSGFNSKTVSAVGYGDMDTFFMHWLGINTLVPAANGTAEESISDIEISLVLDVSGSMDEYIYEEYTYSTRYGSRTYRYNTGEKKIDALKNAAKEFVDIVFGGTADGRTAMSIVPYDSQVNLGPQLAAQMNITTQHTFNNCVDLPSSAFSTTAVNDSTALTRSDHLDPWYTSMPPTLTVCDTDNANSVLALSGDTTALKNRIQGMTHGGNTSVEIGLKWGVALLDPSLRDEITDMIALGQVDNMFAGRPYSYTNDSTMKVVVLMTDGQNTQQFQLNSSYRNQLSGVYRWWNGSQWRYSVAAAEGSGTSYDGDSTNNEPIRRLNITSGSNMWSSTPEGGAAATQLTYQEVFNLMSIDYHAYYFRSGAYYKDPWGSHSSSTNTISSSKASSAYNAWDNEPYTYIDSGTKDARLDTMCTATKDAGVIVFSIGFEVTNYSAGLLEDCASSPSHFYRVNGLEITTAFQSIANAIGKLRLTQ